MRLRKLLSLEADEQVYGVFRQHEILHAPAFFWAAVFLITPFFFVFRLFSVGQWGQAAFFFLMGMGIFLSIRAFLFWQSNVLVVTNKRVTKLTRSSWWKYEVYEVLLREIGEVKYARSGVMGVIFRYGTLMIRPLGGEGMQAPALARPERIMRLIQELKAKVSPFHHVIHQGAETVREVQKER
jgi:hypothetical protein